MSRSRLTRRRFLQAACVTLALPMLESTSAAKGRSSAEPRRRIVAVLYSLGFHSPNFFPEQTGGDFALTRYLKPLADYRRDFTVFSGLSHPRVAQSHISENVFLTGCPVLGSSDSNFRNTVSLDQFAAPHLGGATRFPTLNIGGLSYLPSGARVPGINKPSELFAKLFLSGNADQQKAQKRRLKNGQSILDMVADQARDMQRGLPTHDGQKLEEYFTSVRETEKRLETLLEWEDKPKPAPPGSVPKDVSQRDYPFDYLNVMFDLIVLALQHDSSRLITVHSGFLTSQPIFNGAARDYHNLSHHGKLPEKIDELCQLEDEAIKTFAHLLQKLTTAEEDGQPLLDRTMVLMGSNLGNSNTHETTNLPIILAGGGFQHGRHLAFKHDNNTPLCNLYVSMLQRLGVEASAFGSSKGTLTGLEFSRS